MGTLQSPQLTHVPRCLVMGKSNSEKGGCFVYQVIHKSTSWVHHQAAAICFVFNTHESTSSSLSMYFSPCLIAEKSQKPTRHMLNSIMHVYAINANAIAYILSPQVRFCIRNFFPKLHERKSESVNAAQDEGGSVIGGKREVENTPRVGNGF